MASPGLINGLAIDLQNDQKINDLRYNENANLRSKAMAEARAAALANDFEYNNSVNSFDSKIIKANAQNQIKKIGAYIRENPDWTTNVDKRMQVNQMKRELRDNGDYHRGLASDNGYKSYLQDLQELANNPLQHDAEAYNGIRNEWQNYLKYGNQGGEEAFKTQGKQAFIYRKPDEFTALDKKGQEIGNGFKGAAMDLEYIKNGRDGAYRTIPKKELLDVAANQFYKEHKRQFDVQYTSKGLDPIKAAKDFIFSGIDSKFDIGERNTLSDEKAKILFKHNLENASASGASPYRIAVTNPATSSPGSEFLAKTFGSDLPAFFKGPDGKPIKTTGEVFHHEGNIYDKGYGTKGYQKTGVKQMDGFFIKPLEWGKTNDYTYDPWGIGEHKVKPEMADVVEIVDSPVNDKGESHKVLKVKAIAEVNANSPDFEGRFNKDILTSKQRNAVDVDDSLIKQSMPTKRRQGGIEYTYNSSTRQYE
jgi:hypothetical protein